MDIVNLLNPEVEHAPRPLRRIPRAAQIPRSVPAPIALSKKEKDMPTYRKQGPILPVNYPPYAAEPTSRTFEIQKEHGLFPMGDISEHAAHIPYSSSKTQFEEKTGRTAVEGMGFQKYNNLLIPTLIRSVFMFEFRVPTDESRGRKRYVVYWDYNVGYVKMTNMYKACGLPKVC
jgi:hypothetical protein